MKRIILKEDGNYYNVNVKLRTIHEETLVIVSKKERITEEKYYILL